MHLGSTIGVQKVMHADSLYSAIQEAFQYDFKLIVEEGLTDFREIEFAVLGNEMQKYSLLVKCFLKAMFTILNLNMGQTA
ncbi:D-alanine--D-alanine ligase (plasmid) [Neochlamydia sp. S13]|nr:D-alanine--D-alanine ligase [Neochlamydia sp. S13]